MYEGDYYLFLDESGDHGLSNINPSFPIFLLCGVLFKSQDYFVFRDELNKVKQRFWNSKNVVFHSRDIRRCDKEFTILFDNQLKGEFYGELDRCIQQSEFTVFANGIEKENFIKKYGKLSNVYELCLSFIIERAYFYLRQRNDFRKLFVIIEQRGKKEDGKLKEYISKVINRGTHYIDSEKLQSLQISIELRSKKQNVNGLQLADLVAYPVATHILNKERLNLAFNLIKTKIYQENGKLYGLKTYP